MKAAVQALMSQQIGMTPQLLQSIRLLHLNAMEVEHEVARALEENPLLERVEADDIQTPRGMFELKYFLSAPLADDTIVSLLARGGIHIARRTVAKYRDILRIASAKEGAASRPAASASLRALAAASF